MPEAWRAGASSFPALLTKKEDPMFESVNTLIAEHDDLQRQLSDPELHGDPVRSKRVNRRYAELSRIVASYHEWKQLSDDLAAKVADAGRSVTHGAVSVIPPRLLGQIPDCWDDRCSENSIQMPQ